MLDAANHSVNQHENRTVKIVAFCSPPSSLRLTSVHAGRHAEPPGQQCGAHQAHGHGGGRVPELSHEYQRNPAQISGTVRLKHLIHDLIECLYEQCVLSLHCAVLQYDQDEETLELLSLMTPSAADEAEAEPLNRYVSLHLSNCYISII